MRAVSLVVVLLVATAGASSCQHATPSRAPRPSVLLITIDTLRADALGSYGNARAATPWMDRLAAGGVRFDRAHAHSVVTLPSHANLLSGVYPADHGVRDNAGFRFPPARATLATLLKQAGYVTGAFISAFPLDSRFGLARGFDVYDEGFIDAAPHPPMLEQERRATDTVSLARRWLDAHAGQPTFCWVHLYEPHAPYTPPEPFASRFHDDPYSGEVAAVDAALAPLLSPVLDAAGGSPALVIVTADHGEALGDHGETTHGVFAYEATLRVPLILYASSRLAARVVSSEARHVDVLPTILDAVNLPLPPGLRGRSLLPIATGRAADADGDSYFESLSPALNRGWAPLRGMIHNGLKYIDLPLPELYDLRADPREAHNLVETRVADVRELRQALSAVSSGTPAADPAARVAESADTRARLESLGYVSAAAPAPSRYTESDDPKRLIGLDAQLQEIVRLYTSGDRAQAQTHAEALVRQRPDMRSAWMTLAQIQRDSGQLDEAIGSLRRARSLGPRDPQTAVLLGSYLTERGAAADAITVLTPAATDSLADLQVLATLALAQARAGRHADAVATLERARQMYPANALLLVDLGTVHLMADQRDLARQAFNEAVARNPALARAHSSLGAMNAEDGRATEAIAEWREATRLDPSEYGRIFLLGVSLARAGRAAPARTCLTFVADSAPPAQWPKQIAAAREWLARAR